MKFRYAFAGSALALSVVASAAPVNAATVTDFISFSNSGTYATDGDLDHGYQNASWSGSFKITFDPTQLYLTQPTGGVITPPTFTITDLYFSGLPLSLNTIKYFAFDGAGTLTLSSDPTLSKNFSNTNNLTIGINGWAYGTASDVWYSQDIYGHTLTGSGFATIVDLSVDEAAAPAATPIPAALPLFATGLAGLGCFARRRRKQAA